MIADVRGEGIPLIAIHGFGVDHRIMLPLEGWVPSAGWQRVYLDLPWAAGATDAGVETPKDVADAALAVVKSIAGDGPFAVVGNSFGAMVARHIAHELAGQCVGLATLAGAFELDRDLRRLPQREVLTHDEAVLTAAAGFRADFERMSVHHTPESLRMFEQFVLPGLRGAQLRVLARLNATYTNTYSPETAAAAPFAAPALHVFGRQDHVVGFEDGLAFAEHYADGSFVVVDGAGHNVHLDQPEVVGTHVRDWLARALQHVR